MNKIQSRVHELIQTRRSKGFTLIELMVVLVIITIVIGVTVLSIGDKNPKKELHTEALRLQALMRLASDEAILRAEVHGLFLEDDNYQFVTQEKDLWTPVDDDILARAHSRIAVQILLMSVNGRPPPDQPDDEDEKKSKPQILFFPSGEISSFEMIIRDPENREYEFTLNGSELGEVELSDSDDI